MPSLSHLLLNFLELRPHAVASGFPFDLELSAAACSADEGEAQKIEGLRFSATERAYSFRPLGQVLPVPRRARRRCAYRGHTIRRRSASRVAGNGHPSARPLTLAEAGSECTTGKNRIMIFGPNEDGTYVVEFRSVEGDVLAISIPRTEAAVIRHFQERMPCGLF